MTSSLLSRLQALTAESPPAVLREIDAEIALANGWTIAKLHGNRDSPDYWFSPIGQICPQPPRYTASIDAALTLVPEGLRWEIWGNSASGDCSKFHGEVWPLSKSAACVVGHSDATPAVALLAAALKAKEESKQ